ncbi:MAG: MBL fold metallo-hydrolase [Firmicutes bacterium]|nr:MBL fold metallo-hydrolase [Bacillota bacterium]
MPYQLTPHLKLIAGTNGARFPYSNSLLLEGEETALVDTGLGPQGMRELAPERITTIILTHYHLDHTWGTEAFPQTKVWAHELDAPAISHLGSFIEYTGYDRVDEVSRAQMLGLGYRERRLDRTLRDGEVLDFGGLKLRVLHLPGHTPGHMGFWWEAEGIVYSSDIDATPFGPWYGNRRADIDQFIASIDRILSLKPKILATSHSEILQGAKIEERLRIYRQKFAERDEFIMSLLAAGEKRVDDLLSQGFVYRRGYPEPAALFRELEKMMVEKHLERLLREGRVKETEGRYRRPG